MNESGLATPELTTVFRHAVRLIASNIVPCREVRTAPKTNPSPGPFLRCYGAGSQEQGIALSIFERPPSCLFDYRLRPPVSD
ncbi:hypothetical protein PM082_004961 [Marasmius tenuissimus]|nr:hypothetical protein PM082_004961 [Marasmius tenuissimus]